MNGMSISFFLYTLFADPAILLVYYELSFWIYYYWCNLVV